MGGRVALLSYPMNHIQNLKTDAEKYFENHNLPWMLFYENIADTGTVKAMINVHVYPSFFLVNQKGEIIFGTQPPVAWMKLKEKLLNNLKSNAFRAQFARYIIWKKYF